jgi:probable phosphoglycerate mutase
MIELVFVRHAQPDWEPGGRAVDEPGLTAFGRAQAERLAEALSGEHFDEFYVSPLQRARETAAPVAERLGREPKVVRWLAELTLPPLEGMPSEEVQRFFREVRERDLERWWDGPPGGESFRHFHERVTSGVESLLLEDPRLRIHEDRGGRLWQFPEESRRLLLVAHAGTIAVALSHLLGIEPVPWEGERFMIDWTGIARLRPVRIASGAVWSLISFNDREHLNGLPETGIFS